MNRLMILVLAALISLTLAAPSHHNLGGIQTADPNNPDPGFNGPTGGSNLGGIQVVDHNNPDPGFGGPTGQNLDPGFNGPTHHH